MTEGEGERRALLLLVARGDGLDTRLADEAARVATALGSDALFVRALGRIEEVDDVDEAAAYSRVLEYGLSNGVRLGGYDAVLDVGLARVTAPDAVFEQLATTVERLAPLVDVERSTAVVGDVFVVLDGAASVQLVYCMRRRDVATHQQFDTEWLQHREIARHTPGLAGYRQLHCDLARSAALTERLGLRADAIDGVALEWFSSLAAFASAAGADESFAGKAKSSEAGFNDLERATAILTNASP